MPTALISLLFFVVGSSFFTSYISIRLDIASYSSNFIGLMGAFFYLGMFFGSFHSGPYVLRVGYVRSYATFTAIAAATALIQGLVFVPALWLIGRVIFGYCLGSLYIIIESLLLQTSKKGSKGSAIGVYSFFLYFGICLGQHILGFISDYESLKAYMVASILFSVSVLPFVYAKSLYPNFEAHSGTDIKKIIRTAPSAVLNCCASGLVLSTIYTLFPVILNKAHFGKVELATLLSMPILGGAVFQYPIGKISDRVDRRKIILVLNILALFFLPACSLLFSHTIWLGIMLFFFGGCAFSLYPISTTYACDFFDDPKDYVLVLQTLLLVYSIACIIGPVFAPLFAPIFGNLGIFLYLGLVHAGVALYTFKSMRGAKAKVAFSSTPPSATPLMVEVEGSQMSDIK